MALDAIDYEKRDDFVVDYAHEKDAVNAMVDCPYFKTNFLHLTNSLEQDVTKRDSFTIYMCVGGSACIQTKDGEATVQKGETVLVPATADKILISTSYAKLLEVTI